jgi:hypothetical protein
LSAFGRGRARRDVLGHGGRGARAGSGGRAWGERHSGIGVSHPVTCICGE